VSDRKHVWMKPGIYEKARELMKFYGHSFSGLVCMLIDQAWERLKK